LYILLLGAGYKYSYLLNNLLIVSCVRASTEMHGRVRELFERQRTEADAKFCLAADADADTVARPTEVMITQQCSEFLFFFKLK